jgi:hypothetical protein
MTDALTQFLSDNPLVAAALLVVTVAFVISIMKKLFKFALIAGLVLLLSGGAVYHFAREQFEKHGGKALESGKELLEEGARDVKRAVEEKLHLEADSSAKNPTKQPLQEAP